MAKSVLESWLTSSEKRTTRSGFDGKETIRTLHAHESGPLTIYRMTREPD